MNTRFHKIVLGLLVVLCACLTGLWLQARTTGKSLQTAIATAQASADEALRSSTEENNRITALNAEISERQNALGHTPEAQETKRRAATLFVIEQLKLAHEKNPPAPRQKPPPSGPSGWNFPELLSDPEYNRLYAEQNRRRIASYAKLRTLGLSEEVIDKVVTVLTENYMAFTDYRAVSGKAGIPADFAKQQNDTRDRQLLELMGEETFRRWEAPDEPEKAPHEALVAQAKQYLPKLGTRLSYTDTPLAAEQTSQLAEVMATLSRNSTSQFYRMLYDDAFIQQAAAILTPTQLQALRDFKAEQEAISKRNKLPKSSELPRNTQTAN